MLYKLIGLINKASKKLFTKKEKRKKKMDKSMKLIFKLDSYFLRLRVSQTTLNYLLRNTIMIRRCIN
jgi:hypothetical protein